MPIPGGGPLGGCRCCCPPPGAASSCFAYISCVKVSREQRQQRIVTIENLRGIKRKRKSANENPRTRERDSRERREKSEREREEIDLLFPRRGASFDEMMMMLRKAKRNAHPWSSSSSSSTMKMISSVGPVSASFSVRHDTKRVRLRVLTLDKI